MKHINYQNLNILKPKYEEEIIKDLKNLSQEKKNETLRIASAHGQINRVKLLIENGADVNARNRYGNTPLMLASINGRQEAVRFLIEAGADMNVKDSEGSTSLKYASMLKINASLHL